MDGHHCSLASEPRDAWTSSTAQAARTGVKGAEVVFAIETFETALRRCG
jgi:hypothetical protein